MLRVAEIARPAITDDEILVQVGAASVDRGTWHLMAGLPYPMRLAGFGLRGPRAPKPGPQPGGDGRVRRPKVTGFQPGDEVYGTCDGSLSALLAMAGGALGLSEPSASRRAPQQ